MKPARIKLRTLQEVSTLRPPGYLEECLRFPAMLRDGWVIIPAHRYSALRLRYATAGPNAWQKLRGLVREIIRWRKQGFKVAHWRVFLDRCRACRKCPFSVPGFFPTCGRCGCTRSKLWLASAACREHRWRV